MDHARIFIGDSKTPMNLAEAEIHWFEAHGIGRKDFKIKRVIR
jgi:hypothetical protein